MGGWFREHGTRKWRGIMREIMRKGRLPGSRVLGLIEPTLSQDFKYDFKYGYVTHTNQRGMFKLDLANMRYARIVDLAPYNCAPAHIQFPALCK